MPLAEVIEPIDTTEETYGLKKRAKVFVQKVYWAATDPASTLWLLLLGVSAWNLKPGLALDRL